MKYILFTFVIQLSKLFFILTTNNMNKKFTQISFKNIYAWLPILLIVLVSSCKGKEDPQQAFGSFSVYNVSPTFTTYDAYLNGSKLNSAALPFGGGTKYAQFNQGTYEAKFTVAGALEPVYTKSAISIGNSAFSTLYLTGTAGNFDGLLLQDDIGNFTIEKSYVRFINLSPDAPALDLKIKDGATITTNKAYKGYSGFVAVDPGAKVFEIKDAITGTVKATLESTTLAKTSFYTVISRGKITPNGSLEHSFGGQIILHK